MTRSAVSGLGCSRDAQVPSKSTLRLLRRRRGPTDWYAERSRRAAEAFLNELDRAARQIAEHPEQFPAFEFGTRRIVLHKFPYVLVYRESDTGVEIIAVAHGRRRPGYWRNRVR
jgi:plasmid stabilization system protein ParE